MKTIAQMFPNYIGKHIDYNAAVELFRYLNEEAIAAIELMPDVVIDWDKYPIEDEEQELQWYAERCRWDAEALKDYVRENMWEFEEADFVFTIDYVGNPLNEYQIKIATEEAKEKDKNRLKPVITWDDFVKLSA